MVLVYQDHIQQLAKIAAQISQILCYYYFSGHSAGLPATPVSSFLSREEFSTITSDFISRISGPIKAIDSRGHSLAPSDPPLYSVFDFSFEPDVVPEEN